MLILTRRPNESFYVGHDVKVTILPGGHGNQVRIGIDAPKDVAIDREELRIKKLAAKGAA